MANQISVNSGSGNITVTTSRSVIGTVANVASANYANFAGEVIDPSQPNITSVGNLTNLNVTGTTTTGNLVVLGNLQVGNLVANIANYANFAGEAFNVAGANVTGAVANATFATTSGSANTANSATVANSANAVAGANVSGTVANAAYADNAGNANFANSATVSSSANSVTLANVSGAGNIASINLNGNASTVLDGTGNWTTVSSGANANYANFAGNAFSVDGGNVVGAVANANFAANAAYANDSAIANVANVAYSVNAGNVNGTVANAAYADNAGNATFATNAGTANIANVAYSVDGANVSGTVANATYATNAGTANTAANATYADNAGNATVANSANSVTLANVSGAGNIASINLDGNVSNVLKGDGTFGPEGSTGNANYANFAGTAYSVSGANVSGEVANAAFATTANTANIANIAYSVDGANVSGEVANAAYATNAGTANIANIAYSIDGANVSGTVANATYADNAGNATFATDAGNANIANVAYSVDGANVSGTVANATYADNAGNANVAYSVDVANVSGIGNIATINLDGNVSNALLGDGTFGPVELTTAATVTDNAQPNITSVGNLTSLTINDSVNTNILQYNPAGITVGGNTFTQVISSNLDIKTASVLTDTSNGGFTTYNEYYGSDGVTTVPYAYINTIAGGHQNPSDVAMPGSIDMSVYTIDSDLVTGNPGLRSFVSVGSGGTPLSITAGAPFNVGSPVIATFNYGQSTPANSTLLRSTRRRGNSSARLSLQPNDYLGNIEWRGAQNNGGLPTGGRFARIAPRVDSSYVANTAAQPVGIEFWVTDNTTARSQVFHANGNVTFNNAVNANTITTNSISSSGTLNISTNNVNGGVQVVGRQLQLNGEGEQPPGNGVFSQLNVINGAIGISQDNIGGGLGSFAFRNYENVDSYLNPYYFWRARGNTSNPLPIANNDSVMNQSFFCYGDSGNTFVTVGQFRAEVLTNDEAGNVSGKIALETANNNDGSEIALATDFIRLNGNITTPNDINVGGGNVIIGANGRLDYLRTFGSFTSNATQTSNGANTTNYMTFNNTEDANGVSIVSNTQLTVARTGRYNIQFSVSALHNINQTANLEIWLSKNGTAVANTNSRLVLKKDQPMIAAWNYVDNAANVNDYYQLAWASPDTTMELAAFDTANTISGVAIPSVIATITPVGA